MKIIVESPLSLAVCDQFPRYPSITNLNGEDLKAAFRLEIVLNWLEENL